MDAVNDYARAPDPPNHVLNGNVGNGEQLYDDEGNPLPPQPYDIEDNIAGVENVAAIDDDVKFMDGEDDIVELPPDIAEIFDAPEIPKEERSVASLSGDEDDVIPALRERGGKYGMT